MGEAERGEHVARQRVSFWCSNGHETQPAFAIDAQVPDLWDCPRCGCPAGQDRDNTPEPPRTAPYKTHLASVRERRMNMSITTGTGVLVREGVENGVYTWYVEAPIEIKLAGQTTDMPSQRFKATVRIDRSSTLDNIEGIEAAQVITKPN